MPLITAVSQEDERERVVHFMQDQTLYKFQKKSKEWAGMTMTEMLQILSSLVKRNHVGKSKIYHYLLKFSDQSTFILPTVDDNDYREMLTKLLKESQVLVEVLVEVNFVFVESNTNFKSSYIILKKTNEWMEMEINDYFKLLHDFVNEKDNNLFIAKYSSLKIEFEDKTTFILYNRHLKAIFENEITIDFKEIKNKLLEEGKATVYIFNNIGITDEELEQSKKYEMSFHYYSNNQERNQFTMSLLDIINLNEAQFFQKFIEPTDLTDNDVLECSFSVGAGDSTLTFKTIVCSDTEINFNNECILIVKCMLKWIVAKSKTSPIAKINCNYNISERYLNRGKYKIVQSIKGNKYTEEVMIVSKYFSKNKKLILKKIDKDYIIEYNILMKLNNPYIIKPLDMFKKKDFVYFTMPYFDLGDLKQFFEKYYDTMVQDNTLTKIIIQIIEQVAKGLHYMHHEKYNSQKHILHGDIKEQNVFVTEFDGETIKIVLGDFGFTHLSSNSRNSSLSDRGTLEYLSPEIIRQQLYGYKTDIWSFGIMIYYLLTYEPKDKNNFNSKISIGKDLINSYESTKKKIINEIKQKFHINVLINISYRRSNATKHVNDNQFLYRLQNKYTLFFTILITFLFVGFLTMDILFYYLLNFKELFKFSCFYFIILNTLISLINILIHLFLNYKIKNKGLNKLFNFLNNGISLQFLQKTLNLEIQNTENLENNLIFKYLQKCPYTNIENINNLEKCQTCNIFVNYKVFFKNLNYNLFGIKLNTNINHNQCCFCNLKYIVMYLIKILISLFLIYIIIYSLLIISYVLNNNFYILIGMHFNNLFIITINVFCNIFIQHYNALYYYLNDMPLSDN
ncbi:hypothetical protein ABK040_009923 [Willaertia magna]